MQIIEIQHVRGILVVAVKRVGELLMTTSLIRELKKTWPDASMHVVCDEVYAGVFRPNPYIDSLIVLEPDNRPLQILKVARELSKKEIDVAIDVLANPRSAFLVRASGAEIRIGPEKRIRKFAYTHYMKASPEATPYVADYRLNAARMVGVKPESTSLDFFINAVGENSATQQLAKQQISPEDNYVTFAPISLRGYKRWPYHYFAQVAETLRSTYKMKVVLLGGPGESPQLQQMAAEMKNPPDAIIECHTLDELGALLKRSELLVSNDSGIKHLGVAVKTKTIAIFGYGDRFQWDPNDDDHIALSAPVSCRKPDCYRTCQFQYQCLEMVKPEEVLRAVGRLLGDLHRH